MAAEQLSDEASQMIPSTNPQSNILLFPVQENNYLVNLQSTRFDDSQKIILEFLSNCELTYALTEAEKDVPLLFLQEWFFTSHYEKLPDGKEGIVGIFESAPGETCRIRITPQVIRKCLYLFTLTDLEISHYEPRPSNKTLLEFLTFLGYREPIDRISKFKRQLLPPIWNTMFSILNRTLTCKIGGLDQTTPELLTIMYALFFSRNLDTAAILYDQLLSAVEKKNKSLEKDPTQENKRVKVASIAFPRFLAIIIASAMKKFGIVADPTTPKVPIFIMNSFNPTAHPDGYPNTRRVPISMLKQLDANSPTLASYYSDTLASQPMPDTPSHLGSIPSEEEAAEENEPEGIL